MEKQVQSKRQRKTLHISVSPYVLMSLGFIQGESEWDQLGNVRKKEKQHRNSHCIPIFTMTGGDMKNTACFKLNYVYQHLKLFLTLSLKQFKTHFLEDLFCIKLL